MVEKTSVSYAAGGEKLTRSGYGWSNTESQPVTYGFRTTWLGAMPEDTASFSAFNAVQVAATKLALLAWSDVANITFTQGTVSSTSSSTNPSILFGNYGSGADGAAAFAYLGGNRAGGSASGDVWVNGTLSYNQNPELLRYGVQVLVHEIGHALGLEHPADYDASSTTAPTYAADATFREDTRQYTVMSYFSESNTGANYHGYYASAPQLYDIAAAQRLYGANMETRTGDTVYGFNSNADRPWLSVSSANAPIIFAVWDAGGTDTFDFSGYTQSQHIDLQQTHFSDVGALTGNVSIAQGVVIENAFGGSGMDKIGGNTAANLLKGNAGADSLSGLDGADTLEGGAGSDRLDGGAGLDTALFSGLTAVTVDLGAGTAVSGGDTDTLVSIEKLSGGSGADSFTGSKQANNLSGMAGADTLSGGRGQDQLIGGGDADVLKGGASSDVFVFASVQESNATVAGRDLIVGLTAKDIIDLSAIDADTTTAGDQAFTLIQGKFSGHAGEMHYQYVAASNETLLVGDINGDGTGDFAIRLAEDHRDFDHFIL